MRSRVSDGQRRLAGILGSITSPTVAVFGPVLRYVQPTLHEGHQPSLSLRSSDVEQVGQRPSMIAL